MNAEEQAAFYKKHFGAEYPAARTVDGKRVPLKTERRFVRLYEDVEEKKGWIISRFHDGSASMTFQELQREWTKWKEKDRQDFCQHCSWLHEQADFPAMVRFIMRSGNPHEWSCIAGKIAAYLPQNEAFEFLLRTLRSMRTGEDSNIAQALAHTKHPGALAILRERHEKAWANHHLWDDHPFLNPFAYNAACSIRNLLELGAPPTEFEEQVRQLSAHVCSLNREMCRNHLKKYYDGVPVNACHALNATDRRAFREVGYDGHLLVEWELVGHG